MNSAVRGTMHVVSTLVVVPYLLLAAAFLLLDRAISRDSLLGFLDAVLEQALWLIPWGIVAIVGAVASIATLGALPGSRWFGALCLCALAIGSLVVLVTLGSGPIGSGELTFLVPCMAVGAFSAWLAWVERRDRRTTAAAAPPLRGHS